MVSVSGKLYVIGIGPGDPELLTLKAVRILKQVGCICVPKGKERGDSLALSIISQIINLDNKEIMEAYFPMQKTKLSQSGEALYTKWHEIIANLLCRLNKGVDIAFITLGDPAIYSTFFYLYDKLIERKPDIQIEIIPGISSINAAAAKLKLSLGLADDNIAIIPATYMYKVNDMLKEFDTVVLMKVHRVFDSVLKNLEGLNLLSRAVLVVRAGMQDEKIFNDLREVTENDLNYFSLVIVKKGALPPDLKKHTLNNDT
jgi:precorrin-2/cobalt-factor-2 C20-methyltransferase